MLLILKHVNLSCTECKLELLEINKNIKSIDANIYPVKSNLESIKNKLRGLTEKMYGQYFQVINKNKMLFQFHILGTYIILYLTIYLICIEQLVFYIKLLIKNLNVKKEKKMAKINYCRESFQKCGKQ